VSEVVPNAARFSGRASDYAKYRPSYPTEAIDAVLAGLPQASALTVVDVGAGTGISSRLLTARGARVIGIEPNSEMRQAALASNLDVRDATAENTGLSDGSVDVVAAFQAFHWFATPAAVEEFTRILRPSGRVALVWNVRDDRDAFTKAYGETADLDSTAAQRAGNTADDPDLAALLRERGYSDVRVLDFANTQRLRIDGLIGRARSASYVPKEGPEHDAIVARLRDLHAQYADAAGIVTLVYRTNVHLADRS
jgi:SAM-dependent methyltransferase